MVKKYTPSEKEKYMCEKHREFFKQKLMSWRKEIVESNTKGLYLNELDYLNGLSNLDFISNDFGKCEYF